MKQTVRITEFYIKNKPTVDMVWKIAISTVGFQHI